MRASVSRVATAIFAGLLTTACAPGASPTQGVTAGPSAPPASFKASAAPTTAITVTPAPSPESPAAPSEWPITVGDSDTIFGPDGTTFYLARDRKGEYNRLAIALDAAGHVKTGWPVEAPPESFFGSLTVDPDGSVYLDECGGPEFCELKRLHRLDATGREATGWPFEVPDDLACPAPGQCSLSVLADPSGGIYLQHDAGDEQRVIAIEPDGDRRPDFSLVLDDYGWSDMQVGPDGTLFVVRRPIGTPTHDPSLGVIDKDAQLWAFGSNGKPRPGWPVPMPNIDRYQVAPEGDVVVRSLIDDLGELCNDPRRTVFTVIGPDGRTRPGWPRGSTGFASFPAIGRDGTLYYVSATHRVYAHDRTGEVKDGWPVLVPGAAIACAPPTPRVAPDGTIFVAGDALAAMSPDGLALSGWPYRPAAQVSPPCFDTECFPGPANAGIIAPDGTAYVVVHRADPSGVRAEVVALDRQGRPKAGWPYRVPFDANTVTVSASVSADGRLFVRGGDQLLALDPDGRLAD